jgi:hypothetical protein
MARTVRSARGEMVDMDLLRIKETLGQAPKGATVQAREDFIDNKFKRRLRRLSETVASTAAQTIQAVTPEPTAEPVVEADASAPIPKKKIVAAPTE